MAKKNFWLGILVLVFGMTVIGCDMEPKPCDGDGICTACFGSGNRTLGYSTGATVQPGGVYLGYWDSLSWYRYYDQKCSKCGGNGKCPVCKGEGC